MTVTMEAGSTSETSLYFCKTTCIRNVQEEVIFSADLIYAKTSIVGTGVAQSVQCLVTGWTTWRSRFDPQQRRKNFSSSLCVHTGSGAHPASCPMGTRDPFPGGKARPRRDADHSPHLVPRSRMSRSYTSSPPSAFVACSGTALALRLRF
jgi:hypothetical protein